VTSSSGAAEWRYSYEPFGTIRSLVQNDPLAPENLMRFTGQLFDGATGLYHLRARQFNPEIGRFFELDPLPPTTNGPYVGSYVYVRNRPTLTIDPTGMSAEAPINQEGPPGSDPLTELLEACAKTPSDPRVEAVWN